MANLAEIYDWFMTGKKPTQAQFWASWGSFWNKGESIPQSAVSNLTTVLNAKAEKAQFDAHKTDENAHAAILVEPNARIAALEAKTDSSNNFKFIPNPGYTFDPVTRVLTMAAGWIGTINDEDYTNVATQEFPAIALSNAGYSRIELIVFKEDSTFEKLVGAQSTTTPVAPVQPANTLEAMFLTVGDGVVNVPVTPKPKAPVTSVNGMRGDVIIEIAAATDTVAGMVKTDVTKANPIVYTVETADNLLKAKVNAILEIKPITGIAYTLIAYDTENLVQLAYDGTLPMTVTIPNDATLNLPVGSIFYTVGSNTGALTIAGGAGVTFQTAVGLTAGQNETRKYVKKAANTWQIEGGVAATVSIPLSKIAYVDGVLGNNSTAMIGNIGKPYLTVDAAIIALSTDLNYIDFKIIEIIKSGTYYINNMIADYYNYLFKSDLSITLSWLNNTNARVPVGIWAGQWIFNMPNATIEFSSNVGKSWSNNSLSVTVDAKTVKGNSNSFVTKIANLKADTVILDGGGNSTVSGSFKVKNIITTGNGNLLAYTENNSVVEFDSFTATGNFSICTDAGTAKIIHGNYSTSSTAFFKYISANSLLNIEYKNATIVGNVYVGDHNTLNVFRLTGKCTYTSTNNSPFVRINSGGNSKLICDNLVYKGIAFVGGYGYSKPTTPTIELTNCYIEINNTFYHNQNNSGLTGIFGTPIVVLKGYNTIYCTVSTTDFIKIEGSSTGNTVDVIGTLKTNGALHSSTLYNNILP